MQLRCGSILSRPNNFITNIPKNGLVKNFENRSSVGDDMDKSLWLALLAILYVYRDTGLMSDTHICNASPNTELS